MSDDSDAKKLYDKMRPQALPKDLLHHAKINQSPKIGRPSLAEGEKSERKSVVLPAELASKAEDRAQKTFGDFSKYVRHLIEKDFGR